MKTKAALLSIWEDFIALFYPAECLACGDSLVKGEDTVCSSCLLQLPRTLYPWNEYNPFLEKFGGRLPINFGAALMHFRKTGIAQKLLHKLKYNDHPEIGVRLGFLIGRELIRQKLAEQIDYIIPLPLHPAKERRRGYNQSQKIAEGIAEEIGKPMRGNVIRRVKNTPTQTRMSRQARWKNVADAFAVSNEEDVSGKTILLVDDVMTTGASLEACGMKLLEAGCSGLAIVCLAEA